MDEQSNTERRRRGRPAGSLSTKNEIVETVPSNCPHCGKTGRKVLRIVKELEHGGFSPAGHPRTHIVWRRCQCDACQSYFIEMSHEQR